MRIGNVLNKKSKEREKGSKWSMGKSGKKLQSPNLDLNLVMGYTAGAAFP